MHSAKNPVKSTHPYVDNHIVHRQYENYPQVINSLWITLRQLEELSTGVDKYVDKFLLSSINENVLK